MTGKIHRKNKSSFYIQYWYLDIIDYYHYYLTPGLIIANLDTKDKVLLYFINYLAFQHQGVR